MPEDEDCTQSERWQWQKSYKSTQPNPSSVAVAVTCMPPERLCGQRAGILRAYSKRRPKKTISRDEGVVAWGIPSCRSLENIKLL